MQEIQDLKLQVYTKAEIITYYQECGEKPPSRPTINKYYDMDIIPDDPGEKLSKDKSFDADAWLTRLLNNSYRLEMNGKNMRNMKPINQ